MARLLRIQFPGAIYHVTCRILGDWHADHNVMFRDDRDRRRFLDALAERVEQYGVLLHLFVLMENHVHLVIETPEGNCSDFMQSLLTAYTVYFNLRHQRHGHLLDGRFRAKIVSGDSYLLALSRYVHLNPVFVGERIGLPLAERTRILRAFWWSSYPSYIERCEPLAFVQYKPMMALVGGDEAHRPARYRDYVEHGLVDQDVDFIAELKRSPRALGDESFRTLAEERYARRVESVGSPEDASFRRTLEPLSPDDVLTVLCEEFGVARSEFMRRRRNAPLRAIASRLLIRYASLRQRDVADELRMGSGAAVSNQLVRLRSRMGKDPVLSERVALVEAKVADRWRQRNARGDAVGEPGGGLLTRLRLGEGLTPTIGRR